MAILVVNAGSSSIKVAVYDDALGALAKGSVTEIGSDRARIAVGAVDRAAVVPDHSAALAGVLEALSAMGLPVGALRAAAHRVVHGGADLTAPCRITPAVEQQIEGLIPVAPLHNPANLTGIRALGALAPDLPQYASFDTAFHATNPDVAVRYALPDQAAALGLRRYGFHGLSYSGLVGALRAKGALAQRLLALHLGNGASICAIVNGRSVASSMGYSPLDGLTMGTRAGGIDGNAVLRMAQVFGIDGAARILNRESGLLALGGVSDMRALHAAGTPEAEFALAHFAYWAVRHAGSLVAAMGGVDALAFTGGIGEHDADMRARIIAGLGYLGARLDPAANERHLPQINPTGQGLPIHIIPAEEEAEIALQAMALIAAGV